MKLIKGINRDDTSVNQLAGSWRDAKNIIINTASNLQTEEAISDYYTMTNRTVCGIIPLDQDFAVFSYLIDNDDVKNNSLTIVTLAASEGSTGETVFNSTLLDFDEESPIRGEYKYNFKGERIIIWYADNDLPRTINIDNPELNLDAFGEFVYPEDIIHTRLHPEYVVPNYYLIGVANTGGNLPSGVYYITIQYILIDGSYGNFQQISNPIFVNQFSSNDDWWNITANAADTSTTKYIQLGLSNLDERYDKFRIGILHKANGTYNAYYGKEYYVSNTSEVGIHTLIGLESASLDDLTIANLSFKRLNTSVPINNRLYVANIQFEDDIDYQKYANNIKVGWLFDDVVSLTDYKNSYKDETVLFNQRTLMPGEVYAIYIRFIKRLDNASTHAYHIPGRVVIPYEQEILDDPVFEGKYTDISDTPRRFQLLDTSSDIEIDGLKPLSAWENDSEIYPSEDIYNGLDVQDASSGGVDLRGQKVRHHKMPSYHKLMTLAGVDYGNKPEYSPITQGTVISPVSYEVHISKPKQNVVETSFNNLTTNIGSFDGDTFVNTTDKTITGTIDYNLAVSTTLILFKCTIELYILDGSNNIVDPIVNSETFGSQLEKGSNVSVILYPGYRIHCKMFVDDLIGVARYSGFVHAKFGKEYDASIGGKVLALSLKNINIPSHIKNDCSHYEILFAKRTTNDMTVIGQGVIGEKYDDGSSSNDYRYYCFDATFNKLSLNVSHINYMYTANRNLIDIKSGVAITLPSSADPSVPIDEVYPIYKSRYVAEDSNYEIPINSMGDAFIALYFKDPSLITTEELFVPPVVPRSISNDTGFTAVAISSYKKDTYKSFLNQTLVRTGTLYAIDDSDDADTDYSITKLRGFDTVFSTLGVSTFTPINDDSLSTFHDIVYYLAGVYSVGNIGYRWAESNDISKIFYPRYNVIGTGSSGTDNSPFGANQGDINSTTLWGKIIGLTGANNLSEVPEYYGYDNDLNSLNDLEAITVYNLDIENITEFRNRIFRSIPQSSETTLINWRVFKANEYYDSEYNKGEVYEIATNGKDLLIMHTSALFVTRNLTELRFSDGVITALGSADIFNTKPVEILPTESGYIGCQSKYAAIRTKVGNLIIDREQGKIFIYYEGQVEEISKYGLEKWFKKNLQQDRLYDANEQVNFTSDYTKIDNPYVNVGITAGYDEKYNRIILAKKHINLIPVYRDGSPPIDLSWTLSYYPGIKAWVSFHDHLHNMLFTTRRGLYSLNESDFRIFNTGLVNGNETYIDVVFNQPTSINKRFLSVIWNTVVKDMESTVYNEQTFSSVIVYNHNRHSNEIELTNYVYPTGNVRKTGGTWKFNDFRDLLENKSVVVMDMYDIEELQFTEIDPADEQSDWMKQGLFIDDFIIVRFIFDDTSKYIQINDVGVNSQPLTR